MTEKLSKVCLWCGPYGDIVVDGGPGFNDQSAAELISLHLGVNALDEAYGWEFAPERDLQPEFDRTD